MFSWTTNDGRIGLCFAVADSIQATRAILHYLNGGAELFREKDIQLAPICDPHIKEIDNQISRVGHGGVYEFHGSDYHPANLLPRIEN